MINLNKNLLDEEKQQRHEELLNAPVKILQVGEGNFLRGFVDWMIHECRQKGLFDGSVAVMQPRPSGGDKIHKLVEQDGLYNLVIRGLDDGVQVSRRETIQVFSRTFDPYLQWFEFEKISTQPELRFVVSNTTEAGLVYRPEPLGDGPIWSFPGKITYLLFLRYEAFQGDPARGLVFLPCELLDRNGDVLKEAVLRYAEDWNKPKEFQDWVVRHNRFLNSLVDRIVTGYPEEAQAEAWFAEWGYRDEMLCTSEPYHLWAIEAEEEMDSQLPFRRAGLNVHWTDNLKMFQQRKVRLLNGAHTWMAPLGLLYGIVSVREVLEHTELGPRFRIAVLEEMVPTLPYPIDDLRAYTGEVFHRFANPFIHHRLSDIAYNSLSKFRARLLPTLFYYCEHGQTIPEQLTLGLAGLLRYYWVRRTDEGGFVGVNLCGQPYAVRDDEEALMKLADVWSDAALVNEPLNKTIHRLLSIESLWGGNLSEVEELVESVTDRLAYWEGETMQWTNGFD